MTGLYLYLFPFSSFLVSLTQLAHMCENDSSISSSFDENATVGQAQSMSEIILPLDSRLSRLSFRSADSKRTYRHRVSFDNTCMPSAKPFFSYTLRTASEGYLPTRASRIFMAVLDSATSQDETKQLLRYTMVNNCGLLSHAL